MINFTLKTVPQRDCQRAKDINKPDSGGTAHSTPHSSITALIQCPPMSTLTWRSVARTLTPMLGMYSGAQTSPVRYVPRYSPLASNIPSHILSYLL